MKWTNCQGYWTGRQLARILPPCQGEETGSTALLNDEFVVVLPHPVVEYRPDFEIWLPAARGKSLDYQEATNPARSVASTMNVNPFVLSMY